MRTERRSNTEKISPRKAVCNSFEIEINTIFRNIKNSKNYLDINIKDLELEEDQLFRIFVYLISKSNKRDTDIKIMSIFINNLKNFVSIVQKANLENYSELLYRISESLQLEKMAAHSVLFKTGDKGQKFYVIFRGKVAILVAKSLRLKLSEEDYLRYLFKLRKHEEFDILNRTIIANREIYPLDEQFDNFLTKCLNLDKDVKKQFQMRRSQVKVMRNLVDETAKILSKSPIKSIDRREAKTKNKQKIANPNVVKKSQYGSSKNVIPQLEIENFEDNCEKDITVLDYINRTKINLTEDTLSADALTYLVTVYEYHHILTLKKGDTFGEVALEGIFNRTATIITLEDSDFGSLTKNIYSDCIKESNEKNRKNNINFILSFQIFHGFLRMIFEKKYFNLFVLQKQIRGEMLLSENTFPEYVYFVKMGEYEVSMKKNLFELALLIKQLGGVINDREDIHLFNNKIKFNNKFYHEKKTIRIAIIKEKEAVGLDDFIYENNIICNVQCISNNGEAFKIERKFIDQICKSDIMTRENVEIYLSLKKKILIEKLINYRKVRIENFVKIMSNKKEFLKKCEMTSSIMNKNINKSLEIKSINNLTVRILNRSEKNQCLPNLTTKVKESTPIKDLKRFTFKMKKSSVVQETIEANRVETFSSTKFKKVDNLSTFANNEEQIRTINYNPVDTENLIRDSEKNALVFHNNNKKKKYQLKFHNSRNNLSHKGKNNSDHVNHNTIGPFKQENSELSLHKIPSVLSVFNERKNSSNLEEENCANLYTCNYIDCISTTNKETENAPLHVIKNYQNSLTFKRNQSALPNKKANSQINFFNSEKEKINTIEEGKRLMSGKANYFYSGLTMNNNEHVASTRTPYSHLIKKYNIKLKSHDSKLDLGNFQLLFKK